MDELNHQPSVHRAKEKGRALEAVDAFRTATRLASAYSLSWHHLGITLSELVSDAEASLALRQSVVRAPDHWVTHLNLGQVLLGLQEYEAAVLALTCAHLLSPRSVTPLVERSRAYDALHLFDHAKGDLREALRLEPKSTKLKRTLDRLCEQAERSGPASS